MIEVVNELREHGLVAGVVTATDIIVKSTPAEPLALLFF
jgi:CBS domain containing-hemolysin-like protein